MRRLKVCRIVLAILLLCVALLPPAAVPFGLARISAAPGGLGPTLPEWQLARVGAPVAWAHGADGHGVKVLVIDTGLDAGLVGTVIPRSRVLPSWTFDPRYSAHRDAVGHGSFVVSEIVGNGQGYLGVCPSCQVAMARVFGTADGADGGDVARAYRWGVDHGFQVISMSLGSPWPDTRETAAIAYGAAHWVLCVAASGNDGADAVSYPAADPHCLAVGAATFADQPASFSNFGAGLALLAPGQAIPGFLPFHATLISREDGVPGLNALSGTSMATPLVAGALADLLSLHVAPGVARTALLDGARKPPGYTRAQDGAGILDLTGALRQLGLVGR